jgi:hypothetical protein
LELVTVAVWVTARNIKQNLFFAFVYNTGRAAARRAAQQLHRLNTGIEILNQTADRQARLMAKIAAKTESALRFTLSERGRRCRGRACRPTENPRGRSFGATQAALDHALCGVVGMDGPRFGAMIGLGADL